MILQLRAVLRGIGPLIWRRLLVVPSDTSIAQLHEVLQVVFGWEDMHLHRFEIRGREYGVSRDGSVFFSDGGDTVRELPAFLHPRSEHILDWFHIGMRIEQLMQTARGVRNPATGVTKESILKELGRVKWFLWHGNVVRAYDTLSSLIDEVDGTREEDREAGRPPQLVLKKLSCALDEFGTYIDINAGAIVNYGERR
jgi:hypothetical protein